MSWLCCKGCNYQLSKTRIDDNRVNGIKNIFVEMIILQFYLSMQTFISLFYLFIPLQNNKRSFMSFRILYADTQIQSEIMHFISHSIYFKTDFDLRTIIFYVSVQTILNRTRFLLGLLYETSTINLMPYYLSMQPFIRKVE